MGLSGRKLKLSEFMKSNNISKEYRIGLKNLLDLYPSRVRDKILADSKLKDWDDKHKKAIASITRSQSEFDSKNPSNTLDKITKTFCLFNTLDLQF
jgi:tripeptidyl-peptidase II